MNERRDSRSTALPKHRLNLIFRLCAATMRGMSIRVLADGQESHTLDLAGELERISFEVRRLAPDTEPEVANA